MHLDTDPAKAEDLNVIIHRELKAIADNGVQLKISNKIKEFMMKQSTERVKENGYWLGILSTKYYYGEDNHSNYDETLKSITANDIQNFARNYYHKAMMLFNNDDARKVKVSLLM